MECILIILEKKISVNLKSSQNELNQINKN